MIGNAEDRPYYIDFAPVRGGKIIEVLGRTIARISPDDPTCQLFTGHIGSGKSTELFRLKDELEQQGFYVVYFESSRDLDMADIDITDILLTIVRQVSTSLEAIDIHLRPGYFATLFEEVADFLQMPLDLSLGAELSLGIGKITAKTREAPKLRSQLRQYLEPRASSILQSINEEILARANEQLKQRGNKGLVLIVDNLDRVDARPMPSGRSQQEYLFIDRGESLRKLNCHVVYTIPSALMFSNGYEALKNRLGGGIAPKVLPMVSVQNRDGSDNEQGMQLMRQMALARAFPEIALEQRDRLIPTLFDSPETLDRLCRVSGGHVRNFLALLYAYIQREDPPFLRNSLEGVIQNYREDLILSLDDGEWDLLLQVVKQQSLRGEAKYHTLLRSMFVFEYRDRRGRWFGINPVLSETEKFQQLMRNADA